MAKPPSQPVLEGQSREKGCGVENCLGLEHKWSKDEKTTLDLKYQFSSFLFF